MFVSPNLSVALTAMFDAMTALSSKYNTTPEKASRPYDKNRDGFVISGGGGVLLMEEYEHARAQLKNNKATGDDLINNELLQLLDEEN